MFPCMINTVFPRFILNGAALLISVEVKYLGHFMTDDFRDDRDINRQCHKLYAHGNTLIRKFYMCTPDVKTRLFKTYCTPMYFLFFYLLFFFFQCTAHLWIDEIDR